ncbi:Choline dehydrogenase and related flavoprotein [Gaiella occulta]|uniref:Choline dehydrogenase and related flavoprotein n=1 Tax=Gaiella occulta TaxID=1002870 RepID=A0A7M2Z225_9ACTN|nr:GMC family oxidoreductase [Gaiella occulta]RDI76219.1 Choline dehydrogenase and related flavoprotein [Gaiella occulta]
MSTLECDVAVVGAGSGGCVVAGRLAAVGVDVLLLEAGPDYGPQESGRWPADLLDGGALVTSHDWGYASGDLPGRDPIAFPRARVVGGCSSHNGCIVAVGCPDDYDAWAALAGEEAWSADALRPLFARALERLRVRHYREDEVGPFHRACLDAAAALGLPRADDLDDLDGGVGFGLEPVNIEGGVRVNAAFAYLDPVRGRPRLRILDETLCDRLVDLGDEVELHARRHGEEVRVRAGRVVLAAGTYGSPAILLRSGVGDPGALRALGIEPTLALPGVGRNLHDHPVVELEFAGSDALRAALRASAAVRFTPEEQSLGKLRSSRAAGLFDLHVMPVAAHEHSLLAGRMLLAVGVMEVRSRGRLTLTSADPEALPRLEHGYLSDAEGADLAVLVEGIERVRELAATEPLRSLLRDEIAPGPAADLREVVPRVVGHYYHPVGTCAMGADGDPLAVCDGRGCVRGLERVSVADCSLMPAAPRANTNVPAVVVGERVAQALLSAPA